MNMLQLALLILGILIIVGVIFNALRERRRGSLGSARWTPPSRSVGGQGGGKGLPLGDQMDIFGSAAGEFDEFGVGRPRKVKEGESLPRPATPAAEAPAVDRTSPIKSRKAPTMSSGAEVLEPTASARPEPAMDQSEAAHRLLRSASGEATSIPASPPSVAEPAAPVEAPAEAAQAAPDCVVILFVAERQGQPVPGPRIHAALKAQGLTATPEKIYQRQQGEDVSFSIASLVKPGSLDPAEANKFSSPGLTLYLTVPGPSDPVAALEDLFITSDRLAGALDADVFDQARQPLTAAARSSLRQKVAAAHKPS